MKRLVAVLNIVSYFLIIVGGSIVALLLYFLINDGNIFKDDLAISSNQALLLNILLMAVVGIALISMNFKYLRDNFKTFLTKYNLTIALLILPVVFVLNFIFTVLSTVMGYSDASSLNQDMLEEMFSSSSKIAFFFMVVVLAPFIEEMIFRASIYELFKPKKVVSKVFVLFFMAFAFTLIHDITIITNFSMESIFVFFSYFVSAFILSLAFIMSQNIFVPMLGHLLINIMAFISLLLL